MCFGTPATCKRLHPGNQPAKPLEGARAVRRMSPLRVGEAANEEVHNGQVHIPWTQDSGRSSTATGLPNRQESGELVGQALAEAISVAAVVVALGGVVVSILVHRSNVGRSEQHESDLRIASVVKAYLGFVNHHPRLDTGPSAFVRAGAKNLKSSEEVREAARGIGISTSYHPFGRKRREEVMAYDDLLGVIQDLDATASNWNEVCEGRGIPFDD